MWHVFYREFSMQRKLTTRSYAVCFTEEEANAKRLQRRREMNKQCWVEFIRQRADLDG